MLIAAQLLKPFLHRIERECSEEEYTIKGITLKKGVLFVVPIYSLHHNPDFYPDPEAFDPERFSPENKAKRNPFTYLPFGSGPRNCIAMRFALMEVKVVAVLILHKYKMLTCDKTEKSIKNVSGFGLLQPESLHLKIESRNGNA